MLRSISWLGLCLSVLGFLQPVWAAPVKVSAPDGCPTLTHVPLVTVVRGDPAVVAAQIECATGAVLEVTLYVRLLDAGKPTPISMAGQGDGTYQAIVPIALLRGLTRFWYYIDARGKTAPGQQEEGVAQTRWNPVTILDAASLEGGGGVGSKKALAWLLAGAGAIGGAVLWENHNDGGGSGGPPPPPPIAPLAPSDENEEQEEEEEDNDPPNEPIIPLCIPTGSASASPASACALTEPIYVEVCSSCSNSVIEVSGSWGAVENRSGYNNEGCGVEPDAPFVLSQPPGVPGISVGQFTITVRANGQILQTIPWPDSGYFDCL